MLSKRFDEPLRRSSNAGSGDSSREIAVLRTCELERGGSTAAAPAKTEHQQRVRSTETKRNQPATRPFVGQPVGEGAVSLS